MRLQEKKLCSTNNRTTDWTFHHLSVILFLQQLYVTKNVINKKFGCSFIPIDIQTATRRTTNVFETSFKNKNYLYDKKIFEQDRIF